MTRLLCLQGTAPFSSLSCFLRFGVLPDLVDQKLREALLRYIECARPAVGELRSCQNICVFLRFFFFWVSVTRFFRQATNDYVAALRGMLNI